MNAPVPYVHLASPGVKQDSANSAACWSTTRPVTGSGSPNTLVSPTAAAQSTISGWAPGSRPKSEHASGDQLALSRPSSSVRDAVAAAVTKAPATPRFNHASTVVITPSSPPSGLSQATFGA